MRPGCCRQRGSSFAHFNPLAKEPKAAIELTQRHAQRLDSIHDANVNEVLMNVL